MRVKLSESKLEKVGQNSRLAEKVDFLVYFLSPHVGVMFQTVVEAAGADGSSFLDLPHPHFHPPPPSSSPVALILARLSSDGTSEKGRHAACLFPNPIPSSCRVSSHSPETLAKVQCECRQDTSD